MVFAQSTNRFSIHLLLSLFLFGVPARVQGEYAYQIQNNFQCNDHLESGLSVAPISPLAKRKDYQFIEAD